MEISFKDAVFITDFTDGYDDSEGIGFGDKYLTISLLGYTLIVLIEP